MSSYLTQEEIDLLQDSKLKRDNPFLIRGVSGSQLSIARYYGAMRFNGESYTYHQETDELVRNDVLTLIERRRRKAKQESAIEVKPKGTQRSLEFDA